MGAISVPTVRSTSTATLTLSPSALDDDATAAAVTTILTTSPAAVKEKVIAAFAPTAVVAPSKVVLTPATAGGEVAVTLIDATADLVTTASTAAFQAAVSTSVAGSSNALSISSVSAVQASSPTISFDLDVGSQVTQQSIIDAVTAALPSGVVATSSSSGDGDADSTAAGATLGDDPQARPVLVVASRNSGTSVATVSLTGPPGSVGWGTSGIGSASLISSLQASTFSTSMKTELETSVELDAPPTINGAATTLMFEMSSAGFTDGTNLDQVKASVMAALSSLPGVIDAADIVVERRPGTNLVSVTVVDKNSQSPDIANIVSQPAFSIAISSACAGGMSVAVPSDKVVTSTAQTAISFSLAVGPRLADDAVVEAVLEELYSGLDMTGYQLRRYVRATYSRDGSGRLRITILPPSGDSATTLSSAMINTGFLLRVRRTARRLGRNYRCWYLRSPPPPSPSPPPVTPPFSPAWVDPPSPPPLPAVPRPPPPPPLPPVAPIVFPANGVLVLDGGSGRSPSETCVTEASTTQVGGKNIAAQCCSAPVGDGQEQCHRHYGASNSFTDSSCIGGFPNLRTRTEPIAMTYADTARACALRNLTLCATNCKNGGCW